MISLWLTRLLTIYRISLFVFFWFSAEVTTLWAESQDRLVAEWTILCGGSVRIESEVELKSEVSQLPTDDFRIELVDLVGANVLPPDLVRLSELKGLRFLHLPGPMWNPSSGAKIDYSRDLKHLASISTLEELSFSYTYLDGIKFQDEGIEAIKPLGPSLKIGRAHV